LKDLLFAHSLHLLAQNECKKEIEKLFRTMQHKGANGDKVQQYLSLMDFPSGIPNFQILSLRSTKFARSFVREFFAQNFFGMKRMDLRWRILLPEFLRSIFFFKRLESSTQESFNAKLAKKSDTLVGRVNRISGP
jgi:hypothetical protein